MSEYWHPLGPAADIPLGRMRSFAVDGREVVVCHTGEGWFALDDLCTHARARMSEGRLRRCRLTCPLHGAAFDVRDGRALGPPASASLAVHAVRIAGTVVEVALRQAG
jgi:3-phenylpropionate/trans-cinnamate dioxygenase ferredoxin subunit